MIVLDGLLSVIVEVKQSSMPVDDGVDPDGEEGALFLQHLNQQERRVKGEA